jgi:lipid-binding SYLF domain-containing protein
MARLIKHTSILSLLIASLATVAAHAQYAVQNPSEITVIEATNVFAQAMGMQQNEIPRNLLADCQGIAIMPGMLRGAFVFGVQHGKGVLIARDPNGAWQAPRFIDITGGSVGYQIGISATDLILVFRTPQSVQNLLRGTLKVGVDASAAAGPVGRQTSAGTDLRMAAEILSYSRARGAFVGVAIDGSVISLDPAAEAIYYQPPGAVPASAANLLQWIATYTAAQPIVAPAMGAPGQLVPNGTGGWVPAGQGSGNNEAVRQQLVTSSSQFFGSLATAANGQAWQSYLALPREVYTPGAAPNQQQLTQTIQRYEEVSHRSEFATVQTLPGFQQTLDSLRKMGEVRTASNSAITLPMPPK